MASHPGAITHAPQPRTNRTNPSISPLPPQDHFDGAQQKGGIDHKTPNVLHSVSTNCSYGAIPMAIQHVSLREANQHLSKYIEMASLGAEIIVTKRGRPVARIAPIEVRGRMSDAQKIALERSRARMRQGYSLGGEPFDREAAHAR